MKNCADINIINGHIVLPEIMAPDYADCVALIRAGRAAEVQAEIERREWLRSAEGRAHVANVTVVPMTDEQRAACDAAAEAQRCAAVAQHNRRQMRLRAKYPHAAQHFRLVPVPS